MTYQIILAALVLVPVLVVLFLRVNGAIAFMSLCLGSVLVSYTTSDVTDLVTSFSAKGTLNVDQTTRLALLIIPFLLTLLFTRGSIKGSKKVTNFLPALATGMLFALLVVPLLSANLQRNIHALGLWHQLDSLQTSVLIGGAVFSLLFLLFTHRTKHDDEGKKAHHKG